MYLYIVHYKHIYSMWPSSINIEYFIILIIESGLGFDTFLPIPLGFPNAKLSRFLIPFSTDPKNLGFFTWTRILVSGPNGHKFEILGKVIGPSSALAADVIALGCAFLGFLIQWKWCQPREKHSAVEPGSWQYRHGRMPGKKSGWDPGFWWKGSMRLH